MPKKYEIGQKRYVIVKKEAGETIVKLFEDASDKSVTFPIQRWAQFVAIAPIVDQCLDNMGQQQAVKYKSILAKMVRFDNHRVQLRRCSTVLLEPGAGSQTDAKGDDDTTTRMGQAEGGNTTTTHQVPAHRCGRDVLESTEPLHPGERVIVSGMQSLSVRKRVLFSELNN